MTLIEALKVNGKVRRPCHVEGWYVFVNGSPLQFYATKGGHTWGEDLDAEDILAEDWEAHKEPCKHEPKQYDFKMGWSCGPLGRDSLKVITDPYPVYFMECKLCNAKIRATGWEVVER